MTVGHHAGDLGLRYSLDRKLPQAERIAFELADGKDEPVEHRRKGASDD